MKKKAPGTTEDPASRASDHKTEVERHAGNSGGNVSDGKFEDTPQGGKRRGPGRWIQPETPED